MGAITTKMFFDKAHVRRRVEAGRRKALSQCGAAIMRSTQNQITIDTPKRGTLLPSGSWRGLPLLELRTRRPKPGRLTSWRTRRNPNGFMKKSIRFGYDSTTNTMVIGPGYVGRIPSLNIMHEKGGSQQQRLYIRYRGRPVSRQRAFGLRRTGSRANLVYVGTWMGPRPQYASSFFATARTRRVTVRGDKFMEKGTMKVKERLDEKFRDQIRGP